MDNPTKTAEPKGKRYYERTTSDGPWQLTCFQWFKPRAGITKAINILHPDGSLQYQQINLTVKSSPTMQPRSRFYGASGRLIFTMETGPIPTDVPDAPPNGLVRYVRADGTRICELEIGKTIFTARYFGENDQLISEQRSPHTGDIEFFERDGRNITFEAFETIRDDQGNILERRSDSRVWKYMTSEDGREILRMYKKGAFQRDRYTEFLYDEISFPLLFEVSPTKQTEGSD